ncbi:MAG TPA: zf-TFIIB domain-containing protein [Thermoplasmata archaeon]|nr:zf-TFIIB domain-containing protein [Thermoplasmata archaeon]
MAPLFGPSASDLEHLRSTVRALGTTSVPGLAAALSWRERKTEKLLAHELALPHTAIVYDPARRTVRWALPPPIPAAPPPEHPPAAVMRTTPPPRAPPVPAPSFTPAGLKLVCPNCHVTLMSTGSTGLVVCPQCGRLSSARGEGGPAPASTPAPVATSAGTTDVLAPTGLGDRKSQEMFAAWVTNQPIPCPKCRTPLRHRGVSVYGCPSCGQQVRFPTPGSATALPRTSEPAPPVLPAR